MLFNTNSSNTLICNFQLETTFKSTNPSGCELYTHTHTHAHTPPHTQSYFALILLLTLSKQIIYCLIDNKSDFFSKASAGVKCIYLPNVFGKDMVRGYGATHIPITPVIAT